MSNKMHHFLLIYSYKDGRLVQQPLEFDDQFEAAAAYTLMEAEYRDVLEDFEIVLIGSDSVDTIMKTHGHYFSAADAVSPFAVLA